MTTDAPPKRSSASLVDVGLLVLRIGVGATLLDAGLRKAFDFDHTATLLEQAGWHLPKVATFMITFAETVGGSLLILGLLTPLAAVAVIAAMLNAWAVNVSQVSVWSQPFNHPFVLTFGAIAVLFAGAGAISIDSRLWGRERWSPTIATSLLVVAVGIAILTWVVLNGTNPIHFGAPPAAG
jgi:putative oxidoreductase